MPKPMAGNIHNRTGAAGNRPIGRKLGQACRVSATTSYGGYNLLA